MIMDKNILSINQPFLIDSISVIKMAFTLCGYQKEYERVLLNSLERGIEELASISEITIIHEFRLNKTITFREYILDVTKLQFDASGNNFFVIISPDEINQIMNCEETIKRKISMVRYFVTLIGTFDWTNPDNEFISWWRKDARYQGKIGHMSQQYIANQCGISERSCQRYNDILEALKLIYVRKSSGKLRYENQIKQINNCYSRYEDRYLCDEYAGEYERNYGNHKKG